MFYLLKFLLTVIVPPLLYYYVVERNRKSWLIGLGAFVGFLTGRIAGIILGHTLSKSISIESVAYAAYYGTTVFFWLLGIFVAILLIKARQAKHASGQPIGSNDDMNLGIPTDEALPSEEMVPLPECPKPSAISWALFAISLLAGLPTAGVVIYFYHFGPVGSFLPNWQFNLILLVAPCTIALSLINVYLTKGKYRWLGWGGLLLIPATVVVGFIIGAVIFALEIWDNLHYS